MKQEILKLKPQPVIIFFLIIKFFRTVHQREIHVVVK